MRSLTFLVMAALTILATSACASEPCPAFGSSIEYAKGDPRFSMAGVRGKAALVLFGQQWCPICNKWTPELLSQIEKAWADQPGVMLILVKTDGDAESGKQYLSSHGGDPARWLVVGDAEAAWTKQVMGKDELWQYAVVDPGGTVASSGKAGMYAGGGGPKAFTLATSPELKRAAGAAKRVLPADYTAPKELQRAARLAEIGCFAEAMVAAKAASPADQTAFKSAVLAGAAGRVSTLATTLAGDEAGRAEAYFALRDLANGLKGSEPAKKADEALRTAAKDKSIQRELAAEKTWLGAMSRLKSLPQSRQEATLTQAKSDFAKTYGDTWYAGSVGAGR